jgi:protein tyrosine phosphatase
MLTREVENAMVKCGTYWTDTQYGPLRLELLSTSPPTSPSVHRSSTDASKQGFFFALREPPTRKGRGSKAQPTTITRTFALTHMSYPGVPPRRITHLQYLDWPDMNVPEDPRGVLDLVRQVEKAVAESTPGPSPSGSGAGSGSLSPGSASLSGSQSPGSGSERGAYETTSFFSSLAHVSGAAGDVGGWKKRGRGWRHPELDLKTGIATFALGKPAPVLLHCSAGVGRTGGFIAVDAVLDGVRRELRKSREAHVMKKAAGVILGTGGLGASSSPGASGAEDADVSTETGVSGGSRGDDSAIGEGEEMDIDESVVEMTEETQDRPQIVDTVPLYVTAGDRKKGRRHHHHHGTNLPGEKEGSSSESFVVHVPCAGASDASKGDKAAERRLDDPQKPGWQPSSTREWAEQVSDQTHTRAEEEDLPLPIDMSMSLSSLPVPSRERSPGSASISSGPSALNSADDSVGGSASGSGAERKSAADSGSGDPPPSSVSKSTSGFGSGSISASNSGTGTGSGSRFGSSSGMESSSFMSLMRARLRDSSATSLCLSSTDSSSPEDVSKGAVPLRQPSAIHVSSGTRLGSDMVADHPSRSVSAPLHPVTTFHTTGALHQRRLNQKLSLGSSPVASFSTPALPVTATARGISFFGVDAAEEPVSRPSSGPSSDELMSPPQEFENVASAGVEGSRTGHVKSIQVLSDSSDENAASAKSESSANIAGSTKELETTNRSCIVRDAPAHREAKEKAMIAPMPRVPEDSVIQSVDLGAAKVDRRAAGHSVIDYKLPRELHSDLSPPPISSLADPICMVVQDMREQRMSLCQSLRQYVFVHAAVIEGALEILDEERELWGDVGGSDEGHFAEIELGPGVSERGRKFDDRGAPKVWFGGMDTAEGRGQGGIRDRTRSLPNATYTTGPRRSEGGNHGGQPRPTSASSSSGITSSPSKGKRGPSPTELCREDKTGALSLNKRPSIKYKLPGDEAIQSAFASGVSSSMAGGAAKQTRMSTTWSMLGGPSLPPKGTPSGPAR